MCAARGKKLLQSGPSQIPIGTVEIGQEPSFLYSAGAAFNFPFDQTLDRVWFGDRCDEACLSPVRMTPIEVVVGCELFYVATVGIHDIDLEFGKGL